MIGLKKRRCEKVGAKSKRVCVASGDSGKLIVPLLGSRDEEHATHLNRFCQGSATGFHLTPVQNNWLLTLLATISQQAQ